MGNLSFKSFVYNTSDIPITFYDASLLYHVEIWKLQFQLRCLYETSDDTGALTVCHHILTSMDNSTDDFNNIDIKVSFNVKQEIGVYTPL
jgi:hypothetical protein